MAAGTTPVFVATPKSYTAQVTTANTNRDGSGSLVTLATGGANGSIIPHIRVVPTGTIAAATVVRIFKSLDNGSTKRLLKEIMVAAVTPSSTVEAAGIEWTPTVPITLPDANGILYASVNSTDTLNVFADGGGDY